jgi:hypothetical protein
MRPIGASLVTLTGIAFLWYCATRPLAIDAEPLRAPAPVAADLRAAPVAGVVMPGIPERRAEGRRNLFGYREPPPRVVVAAEPAVVPQPVALPPAPASEAVEPPAPSFGYRYIGSFGHDPDLIVAFVSDGDVRTIRRGERIGDFTLTRIGIESVDVTHSSGAVVRVTAGSR